MYAIVDIAGQQLKVEKGRRIFVHRLEAEQGDKIQFEKVLLIDNDTEVKVGKPTVEGATVSATVLEHLKGDKVEVFKKKRRKGYKVLNGHRQYLTQLMIDGIVADGMEFKEATAEAVKEEPQITETSDEAASKNNAEEAKTATSATEAVSEDADK